MLISKVSDESIGEEKSSQENAHEYETANELFEFMTKNQKFDNDAEETLTTSDLVLLYRNIDPGTQLMAKANTELQLEKSNQYIETIIYSDSDDSDFSEVFSTEDIHNVVKINEENLDLYHTGSPVENIVCHKYGDFKLPADLNVNYDSFIFKNHYITEQLINVSDFWEYPFGKSAFPASILDYVSCKRLDDNVVMDNVIRHVKHTIEQLKRISNGDYLTEKAKEKWKEANADIIDISRQQILETIPRTILPNTLSISLQVENRSSNYGTLWEDIVHSEIDIRTLSKLLEKKIVLEIPKLIAAPCRIFDKRIFGSRKNTKTESKVNVILKLEKSNKQRVIKNINSATIIKIQNCLVTQDDTTQQLLALPSKEVESLEKPNQFDSAKIPMIDSNIIILDDGSVEKCEENIEVFYDSQNVSNHSLKTDSQNYPIIDNLEENYFSTNTSSTNESGVTKADSGDTVDDSEIEKPQQALHVFHPPYYDGVSMTMQLLNMQSVPEENFDDSTEKKPVKKKSSAKIRIKSPYQNKSFLIEEKKRKRLLEIRERREKKKMAMTENRKNSKNKHEKLFPRASNSVTKLSITNKYFYNSIYGSPSDNENKSLKSKIRKDSFKNNDEDIDKDLENKYGISNNESYYFDDTETEMMHIQMKQKINGDDHKEHMNSAMTSPTSDDFRNNLIILSQLINDTNESTEDKELMPLTLNEFDTSQCQTENTNMNSAISSSSKFKEISSDGNAKEINLDQSLKPISVECRNSIDKIYELMNDLKPDSKEESNKNSCPGYIADTPILPSETIIQGSESGTSLKHQAVAALKRSAPLRKQQKFEVRNAKNTLKKVTPIEPKVVISTKTNKIDADRNKSDRKKNQFNSSSNNPLRAISQLLHEFEDIQKPKNKLLDIKPSKKEIALDPRTNNRSNSARRYSRIDNKEEHYIEKPQKNDINVTPRDRKQKNNSIEVPKPQNHEDEKKMVKSTGIKFNDIIDEVKEARGEAVRGPSRLNSRLNSLAQPKKSYVQAHSEEYQTRYGRNLMAHRLQKLAETSSNNITSNVKVKPKKPSELITLGNSIKTTPSSLSPIEVTAKQRIIKNHSSNNEEKQLRLVEPSNKKNVAETPETSKKKEAVVDTCVKSVSRRVPLMTKLQKEPLVPSDIELVSLATPPMIKQSANAFQNQSQESIQTSIKKKYTSLGSTESTKKSVVTFEDIYSSTTQSNVDIFQDKTVVTAVGNVDNIMNYFEEYNCDKMFTNNQNSQCELENLENALYRKLSEGTFQKKLRLKNLTLTPRHSIQQMLVVQSGDHGSFLVKSSVSQTKIKTSKSDLISDIKTSPLFSKSNINLEYPRFPLQITTVGYVFPKYNSAAHGRELHCNQYYNINNTVQSSNTLERRPNTDKSIQCFKGGNGTEHLITSEINRNQLGINNTKSNHKTISTNIAIETIGDFATENTQFSERFYNAGIENTENKIVTEMESSDNIDYTTSFDMLVGLLNEIQKISTCQTNMTNKISQKTIVDDSHQDNYVVDKITKEVYSKLTDIISVTSLDEEVVTKQNVEAPNKGEDINNILDDNQIEIFPQLSDKMVNTSESKKQNYIDKDTNVDLPTKEYCDSANDVPSTIFKVTHNNTDKNLDVLCQTSRRSIFSCVHLDSNISDEIKTIQLAVTDIESEKGNVSTVLNINNIDNSVKKLYESKKNKLGFNKKIENIILNDIQTFKDANEADPNLNMKRDILVTVYSILVMTVFAALSLPDLIYC